MEQRIMDAVGSKRQVMTVLFSVINHFEFFFLKAFLVPL